MKMIRMISNILILIVVASFTSFWLDAHSLNSMGGNFHLMLVNLTRVPLSFDTRLSKSIN